jgi:hypothetical protein
MRALGVAKCRGLIFQHKEENVNLNAHAFDTELGDTIIVSAAGEAGRVHLSVLDAETGRTGIAELTEVESDRLIEAIIAARDF